MLALMPLLGPILERLAALIPDPEARAKAAADAEAQMVAALRASDSAQGEVNRAEAAHASIFVAGWRPAIGWVCALALGYQYLVAPLASFGLAAASLDVPPLPRLDDGLWQLVTGMLGLGVMRTYEKIQGAASLSLSDPGPAFRGR